MVFRRSGLLIIVIVICLAGANQVFAKAVGNITELVKTQKSPISVAITPNGRYIYILEEGGKLSIFSSRGKLKDTLNVGSDVDGIQSGPWENRIFLTSRKSNSVRLLDIQFVENIDISASPYKGPENAPITLITFDDFE